MKIRAGWSSEYAREKFDVEMDEDSDLPSIVSAAGLEPAMMGGDDWRTRIPNFLKCELLKVEAEVFALCAAVEHGVVKPEQGAARQAAYAARRAALLTQLRSHFGFPLAESPAESPAA
jgi:hypothetical protein